MQTSAEAYAPSTMRRGSIIRVPMGSGRRGNENDLARQGSGIRPGMNGRKLTEREALGDIDV